MVSISLVTRQQQTILFIGGGAVAERRLRPFLDEPYVNGLNKANWSGEMWRLLVR